MQNEAIKMTRIGYDRIVELQVAGNTYNNVLDNS